MTKVIGVIILIAFIIFISDTFIEVNFRNFINVLSSRS